MSAKGGALQNQIASKIAAGEALLTSQPRLAQTTLQLQGDPTLYNWGSGNFSVSYDAGLTSEPVGATATLTPQQVISAIPLPAGDAPDPVVPGTLSERQYYANLDNAESTGGAILDSESGLTAMPAASTVASAVTSASSLTGSPSAVQTVTSAVTSSSLVTWLTWGALAAAAYFAYKIFFK